MSNDRYENIRKALKKGLTPGPWEIGEGRTDTVENAQGYPVCTVNWHPNERYGHGTRAAYIAACDPDTIRELLNERDALKVENEKLRAEVERLRADRDSWEQQASDRVADWHAEHLRAEQLEEALREWWKAHRPVGWTEDQHRSCPHVNLTTDAEKALADALLRAREASND